MDQLSLFNTEESYRFPEELLVFKPNFLTEAEADRLQQLFIKHTRWEQTSITLYDKIVLTPRLTAWYGNKDGMLSWTDDLLSLKDSIEKFSGTTFNAVLLNYYRDGNDSVAWHRDKESDLGNRSIIASLSLGETRNFDFRSVSNHSHKYVLPLKSGALLLMKGELQLNWEHRIAKSSKISKPRVNLTFRNVRNR